MNRFYTANQVADRLNINVYTLRRWAREGLIPAGRTPGMGQWRFSETQVREIADAMEGGYADVEETSVVGSR